jgi:flagellar biosynthetic protein FliR
VHLDVSFLPAIGAAFLLIFARTGTMVMLLPGLGEQNISPRLKLTIALVLAAVLLPLHRPAYHIDTSALGPTIVLLVEEIMIGAVLGLTARLTISALEVAGSVIAQQLGLGFVTTIDPTQGEQGVIIGNFLTMLGITLFFATDMHYLVIAALNSSYDLFEPGEVPAVGDVAALVTKIAAGAFRIGIHAVPRLRAAVQYRARRAVAADAADAGVFRRAAAVDPARAPVLPARARHHDGFFPRLRRRRAARARPARVRHAGGRRTRRY